ncbi:sigma-70 family RNA polymerase sigma factor [Paenibacillus sp. S150]|uniref:sigma-70 family RNA polymerase sigma factor n=1 Tax=Paenibacillus sp. S150 TaxID=2749826 RepID=UPI001C5A4639|nr:sigma-70 family RNA polymerase sigma factor [Paenibacillus sp. S150]MBW4083589.1 sigma-70 family RNA polymerase sigma factor [Paenibacillus sp. S150]
MNLLKKNQLQLYEISIDDSVDLSIRYECCRRMKAHEHYNPHLGDMTEFIQQNKGLVYDLAYKHRRKTRLPVEVDDLIQEGFIGLIKAYNYYDPSKGEFSTLAYPIIRNEMMMYMRDRLPSVKPPSRIYDLIGRILKYQLDNSPPEVIAKALEVPNESAERALWYMEYGAHTSLNQPVGNINGTEVEYSALIGFCEDESGVEVEDFLNALPDRLRKTILYLMAGYNIPDIAREFGISRAWGYKLLEKAQEIYLKDRRRSTFVS